MFGMPKLPIGMFSVAGLEPNVRNNDQDQVNGLTSAYAAARAANRTPNGRVARGWDQFGPANAAPYHTAPMLPTPPTPAPVDMGALSSQAHASQPDDSPAPPPPGPMSVGGAPLPNVGPTSVGGAPLPTSSPLDNAQWPAGPVGAPQGGAAPGPGDMGFFARNTAMMQDPNGGGYIDPQAGQSAQASGPDVINKLLSYFHQKDA